MSTIQRILALATALASMAAVSGASAQTAQTVHTGSLDSSDSTLEDGESYDLYSTDVRVGQEIIAIATALDFDPYLIVVSPSGEQSENDDFADSPDVSLVQTVAAEEGTWYVKVTSYGSGESGEYALVLAAREYVDEEQSDEEQSDESFTVSGAIPSGENEAVFGTLDESDYTRTDESLYDGWSIDVEEGEHVVVVLISPDFDAYLTLVSPTGRTFDDDDGYGGTDSRLDMTIDESGRWTVVANTLSPGDTGGYTLTVERQ
jgi:hypothetical protein